jgi:transcriptional regulator with XRE-family HTH domain
MVLTLKLPLKLKGPPMAIQETFSERLRDARLKRFRTQIPAIAEVNRQLSVMYTEGEENRTISQPYYSELENGVKMPSARILPALALAFETNVSYLLGMTDDPNPASDLEDQVTIGVSDDQERHRLQQILENLRNVSANDQMLILAFTRKMRRDEEQKHPAEIEELALLLDGMTEEQRLHVVALVRDYQRNLSNEAHNRLTRLLDFIERQFGTDARQRIRDEFNI